MNDKIWFFGVLFLVLGSSLVFGDYVAPGRSSVNFTLGSDYVAPDRLSVNFTLSEGLVVSVDLVFPGLNGTGDFFLVNSSVVGVWFNASDDVGLDSFWLNDTSLFGVNQSGFFTNVSVLVDGNYSLNLSVNDTSGNVNSSLFVVEVESSWLLPGVFSVLSPVGLVSGDVLVSWGNTTSNSNGSMSSFNVTIWSDGGGFLGVLRDDVFPGLGFVWESVGNDWGDGERVIRVNACDSNGFCRVAVGDIFLVSNTVYGGGSDGFVGRDLGGGWVVHGLDDFYVVYRSVRGGVFSVELRLSKDSVLRDAVVSRAFLVRDGEEFPVSLERRDVGIYGLSYDFTGLGEGDYDLVVVFDDVFVSSVVSVSDANALQVWGLETWDWFSRGLEGDIGFFRLKAFGVFLFFVLLVGGLVLFFIGRKRGVKGVG